MRRLALEVCSLPARVVPHSSFHASHANPVVASTTSPSTPQLINSYADTVGASWRSTKAQPRLSASSANRYNNNIGSNSSNQRLSVGNLPTDRFPPISLLHSLEFCKVAP